MKGRLSREVASLTALVIVGAAACAEHQVQHPAEQVRPAHVQAQPAPARRDQSPWLRLVAQGLVWNRPDLQPLCKPNESAYFLAKKDKAELATVQGVKCRSLGKGRLGADLCCPSSLPTAGSAHTGGGESCEVAVEKYVEHTAADAGPQQPGASTAQYSAVLNKGSYLAQCNAPNSMGIAICAAVQDGHAVGVTVRTVPNGATVADCIAKSVRGLAFPKGKGLDVAHTKFAPQ